MTKSLENQVKQKNPYFKNVEKKQKNQILTTKTAMAGVEFLKLLFLIFISAFFILIQYGSNWIKDQNTANVIEIIYLYSIGLVFGDLTIFIIIGVLLSLIINWLELFLKKYYFKWFSEHLKIDYWFISKRLKLVLWSTIICIVMLYHWTLLSKRELENNWLYSTNDLKNIFQRGWYYSFTQGPQKALEIPNAKGNIGVLADTIFNILHVISFGPYLMILSFTIIQIVSWLFFITINPLKYFKKYSSKKTPIELKNNLKKINSLFIYTDEIERYFEFIDKACKILEIDIEQNSLKKILKLVRANYEILSTNVETFKYYEHFKSTKQKEQSDEMKFKKLVDDVLAKQNIESAKNMPPQYQASKIEEQLTQDDILLNADIIEDSQNTENTIEKVEFAEPVIDEKVITNNQEIIDNNSINNEQNDLKELNQNIDRTIELRSIDTVTLNEVQDETCDIILKPDSQTSSMKVEIKPTITNSVSDNFVLIDTNELLHNDSTQAEITNTNDYQNIDKQTKNSMEFVNINTQEIEHYENSIDSIKEQPNDEYDWISPFE
ncbi:hypothetical protein MBVG596_1093 [Mycoplasmopsis bovigenitalium]|uniref:hypothetical protein n=1 Tax=Mycoplasmopsis bovigenitalium TaxID=2112 RepID=UPI00090B82E1|nr:hypothetical protein [Mycoplasmopsis bovigenitalium]BAW18564.1 hypothetical protein MBVG596_1093 [Mycoplasmopsis bovigenitalium]